ncbi:MAG: N-acetylglucosamine-6-phosphate deacetylase [Symbiobacteriaceae bacterium]|nr:N-acetylglucosamine-6-phosphate deacetylase [Symbiobacteriaceae bacterium]
MVRWLEGAVVLTDRVLEHGLVAVDGSRIGGVWDLSVSPRPQGQTEQTTTRLKAGYISPGFIDIHIHGGGGGDFLDADPEAVAAITETHSRFGTTGMLCTTLTASEADIVGAIRAAKAAPRKGARILGYHVEGPFINARFKGAQDERYARPGTTAEVDRIMAEGRPGDVWHFTIAPELPGHLEVIRHMAARGAVVSAGHTECTYDQLAAGAEAGVRHVTHLYNAMRGLHHREPGTVGAALTLPNLTVELIADGFHIHPAALKVAVAARGAESVILVSDAMRATGLPDGEYSLGVLPVWVKDGQCRLADGTIASSVLTMNKAVKNMVELAGVSLPAAVAMASRNPARRYNLPKGAIAPGLDADLVLLDPELNVLETIVGGETVFTKGQ